MRQTLPSLFRSEAELLHYLEMVSPQVGLQFTVKKILPVEFTAPDSFVPYTSLGYSSGRGKSIILNRHKSFNYSIRKKEELNMKSEDEIHDILAKNNIVVGYSNYDDNDELIDPMLNAFDGLKTINFSDIASVEMNSPSWLDVLKWIDKQVEAPMYFFEGLDIKEDTASVCIGT